MSTSYEKCMLYKASREVDRIKERIEPVSYANNVMTLDSNVLLSGTLVFSKPEENTVTSTQEPPHSVKKI